jgi:hypothetical protein
VLWDFEHKSFWYAGLLDRDPDVSHCVPEAHFEHSENLWINERIWGQHQRDPRWCWAQKPFSQWLSPRPATATQDPALQKQPASFSFTTLFRFYFYSVVATTPPSLLNKKEEP